MLTESVKLEGWELVDPVQTVLGSLNGTKPKFYQKGKTLLMVSFPHPAAVGTAVTVILKPEFKLLDAEQIGVLNYSGWSSSTQVFLQLGYNLPGNAISSPASVFSYFLLYAPVVLMIK